jgi:hypothetical protein
MENADSLYRPSLRYEFKNKGLSITLKEKRLRQTLSYYNSDKSIS